MFIQTLSPYQKWTMKEMIINMYLQIKQAKTAILNKFIFG